MTLQRLLLPAVLSSLLLSVPAAAQPDLAARVRASFASCELRDGDAITVSARDGAVFLRGHVRTLRERECVAFAAESVSGVRFLEPQTVVRPAVALGDDALAERVLRALREAPEFAGPAPLNVVAEKGRVLLGGEVRVPDDKYRAEQVVRDVEGVLSFDNQIVVDPQKGLRSMEVQLLELLRVREIPVEGLRFFEEQGRVVVAGRTHEVLAQHVVQEFIRTLPGGNLVASRLHVVLGPGEEH